jgi:hypothetical protein
MRVAGSAGNSKRSMGGMRWRVRSSRSVPVNSHALDQGQSSARSTNPAFTGRVAQTIDF